MQGSESFGQERGFSGPAGSSMTPPIGTKREWSLAHLGYTLYVRGKALAMQHFARQARNTKLIDPETRISLRAERRAARC
jgi:hypothetical protein